MTCCLNPVFVCVHVLYLPWGTGVSLHSGAPPSPDNESGFLDSRSFPAIADVAPWRLNPARLLSWEQGCVATTLPYSALILWIHL